MTEPTAIPKAAIDESIYALIRRQHGGIITEEEKSTVQEITSGLGGEAASKSILTAFFQFCKNLYQSIFSGGSFSAENLGVGIGSTARDTRGTYEFASQQYKAIALYEALQARGGVYAAIAEEASGVRPHAPGTPHQRPIDNPNSAYNVMYAGLHDKTPRDLTMNKPRYAMADVDQPVAPLVPANPGTSRNRS